MLKLNIGLSKNNWDLMFAQISPSLYLYFVCHVTLMTYASPEHRHSSRKPMRWRSKSKRKKTKLKNSCLSTKKTPQQRCSCSFQWTLQKDAFTNECVFISNSHSVWQETTLREQVEGLVEEDEEQESPANEDGEDVALGAITLSEKKTERQRKREKAEKIKVG